MPSPLQTFQDNIRPAHLMLRVYSLLDTNDHLMTEGELVNALRGVIKAGGSEDVIVIYNEIFLGLVRECAQIPHATLRRASLAHLLRQAVVAACTGLDTYLPALLRANLPTVIQAVGRDAIPTSDGEVMEQFRGLSFTLDDALRLINHPHAAEFISDKILGSARFQYLSSRRGVHVVGRLLGLDDPWERIAEHLRRDKKELTKVLNETVERRNDIVHRADRSQDEPDGDPQEISYSWAKQAVDTVEHICLALDELVAARMHEYRAALPSQ